MHVIAAQTKTNTATIFDISFSFIRAAVVKPI